MRSNSSEVTFTQAARREQMIQGTIDTVSDYGLHAASLARIAERLSIAKGGILYHFASREELVNASLDAVFERLAQFVIGSITSAESMRDAVHRYIIAMVTYLDTHRNEVRLIAEGYTQLRTRQASADERATRWRDLAGLIDAASAEGAGKGPDPRVLAITINGGVDALIAEAVDDPSFDLQLAGRRLAEMVDHLLGETYSEESA